jgi:hypothetical protein
MLISRALGLGLLCWSLVPPVWAQTPAGRPPSVPGVPPEIEDQRLAAVAAERFLDTLLAGEEELRPLLAGNPSPDALLAAKAARLAGLGTNPFTFDGRQAAGPTDIMRRWRAYLEGPAGKLVDQPGLKLSVFGHKKAVELFGPAPAKLAHLALDKCMFAAVTFEKRRGFLLVLTRNPAALPRDPRGRPQDALVDSEANAPDAWLVSAVTE